ncbi:helix-turn-helix domain-containing protein [Chryseolinea soli]|uniref:Transcriptional regulator n=1 Tax=Chryseolinea soli TaxID=2321403 RepID=A0A385SXX9_9BACT|nr:helix-turn-helix domain-containing protein [Chryseolinea soli]AYB35794.1 transcriptional regulator [Chryseolinea soli]
MDPVAEKKTWGTIIQTRRKSRNIQQAELADIAGISTRTLREIEKGSGNPELDTLLRICSVLGMQIKIEVIT